jgi:hypothetical protein
MPGAPEAGGAPPPEPSSGGAADPGSPEEMLRRLEQRLDRASEAAERLMAQAAAEAARAAAGSGRAAAPGGSGRLAGESGRASSPPGAGNDTPAGNPATPPPAGWQTTDHDARESTSELDPLVALIQAMRDLIPPELQQRLIAAFREVLLALRALIDWYLERLDRRREQGVEVQDIPIL